MLQGLACPRATKQIELPTRQLIIGIVGSGGRGAQVVMIETLGEAAKLLPLVSGQGLAFCLTR